MGHELRAAAQQRPVQVGGVQGSSWLSLVAATTPGMGELRTFRVRVLSDVVGRGNNRLIVQAYAAGEVVGGVPRWGAKPACSAQRAVSDEELRRGVDVTLVHVLGQAAWGCDEVVVVAWVEPGNPVLEFDGRRARPSSEAPVAAAECGADGGVLLELKRAAAVAAA